MKRLVFSLLGLMIVVARGASLGEPLMFTGTCDASTATALSGDLFVVANDEDNILRFYRTSQPGKPVQTFDLQPILYLKGKSEMDLEGAARLGDKVFFISSHGQNAEGKYAANRHRFFAVQFTEGSGGITVRLSGKPYTNLAADLAADPRYARFHLAEAAGLPPKATGGFNLEALTDTPEGTLLLGFRSPVPEGRALVAPLLNPNEVIAGESPKFGDPVLLDLGGLGLRGVSSTAKGYYLLAGPVAGPAASHLFFWAGGTAKPHLNKEVKFHKINPEGICLLGVGGESDFLVVSDDGSRNIGGKECKTLPESERQFRAYRFTP
ncbi:MAG: DUF3616 domain-containing protein [Verrucomicrobiota bacterium]